MDLINYHWRQIIIMNTVQTRLREFKLAGIYANLSERLSYAKDKSLSHLEFLELLVDD